MGVGKIACPQDHNLNPTISSCYQGTQEVVTTYPCAECGEVILEPHVVLQRRIRWRGRRAKIFCHRSFPAFYLISAAYHFHTRCVKCSVCQKLVGEGNYTVDDDDILCPTCWATVRGFSGEEKAEPALL